MPQVRSSLIDERDRYLTEKIRTAPGQTIAANVVGFSHLPGIKRYWDQPIDLESLETLPPKSPLSGFLKWFIPFGICALIIYGFFRGGAAAGADMITWWVMANGILAGLGALIALGHPLIIPIVHPGGAGDFPQPHDCRGMGVELGGGLFRKLQG